MALHGINAAVVPSGIFYNADEVHPRGMWNIMTNGTPPHYQSRNFFQNFFPSLIYQGVSFSCGGLPASASETNQKSIIVASTVDIHHRPSV